VVIPSSRRVRVWLIGLSFLGLIVLAAVLFVIWVAGQLAGVLADHWPPVSYPVGALGELAAVLTHPRGSIGPRVPTTGFWLYLGAELGILTAGGVKVVRSRRWARSQPWIAPTVVSGGARQGGDRFLHAYDQIARRDADQ
jgi:hypothetical protein